MYPTMQILVGLYTLTSHLILFINYSLFSSHGFAKLDNRWPPFGVPFTACSFHNILLTQYKVYFLFNLQL